MLLPNSKNLKCRLAVSRSTLNLSCPTVFMPVVHVLYLNICFATWELCQEETISPCCAVWCCKISPSQRSTFQQAETLQFAASKLTFQLHDRTLACMTCFWKELRLTLVGNCEARNHDLRILWSIFPVLQRDNNIGLDCMSALI